MKKNKIYVLGGGTVFHIRPHLALSAPAYGKIARDIYSNIVQSSQYQEVNSNFELKLGLTKMAFGEWSAFNKFFLGETNEDVEKQLNKIIEDKETKIIFLTVAFCDYVGHVLNPTTNETELSGKEHTRLKTKDGQQKLLLTPAEKIISKIRKTRKDIFLVACKTTSGASENEQYESALNLLKKNSCNLVLANDVHTRNNMIVAPELAKYEVTTNRAQVIKTLVDMTLERSQNTFTRTRITSGYLVKWTHPDVPETLRKVVDWCVDNGAYKPFNNVTVGHFGFKPESGYMWSSRRKKNFNKPEDRDLVIVDFRDEREQLAYGEKPSAGARSQYTVLNKYSNMDCIVHFHCPLKPESVSKMEKIHAIRPQKYFECGSHECGQNTAAGMQKISQNMAVVMLDKHGPNIVFSRDAKAEKIIAFISEHFDLNKRTE